MPKTSVGDWSTSAAANTDIDGNDIGEGCSPAGINDAVRSIMAQAKTKFSTFDSAIAAVTSSGIATLVKDTQANLYADLAHADGTIALVRSDPVAAKNDLYAKIGASGSGSWSAPLGIFAAAATALVQSIADAATASAAASAASATISTQQASAAINQAKIALEAAFLAGSLPTGFIDPADHGISDYSNDYGVKFYSTGSSVWPMIPVSSARTEWLAGGIVARLAGVTYASVSVPMMNDPTRQGTAFNTYYVNYTIGADSGAGTTSGAPWKRLSYAIATATKPALIVVNQDWIGSDSFPSGDYSGFGKLRILGVPQTVGQSKTWLLTARESPNMTGFAWTDNGDGSWTSNASMPDNIKNSPGMFDLSILDADGAPLPLAHVASKILCRSTPNSWFNDTGTSPNTLTVHLASGARPNPGVNWTYTETGEFTFGVDDGEIVVLENLAVVGNAGAAALPLIYARALNVTIPGPRVAHTGQFWTINCAFFGSSGNGIQFQDIARGGCDYPVVKYCRDDGVNAHTFYTFGNVNTGDPTLEGRHIHIWHFGGRVEAMGDNGFVGQPTLAGSSQVSTCHDQCRMTRLNVVGGYTNGSTFADVNGAQTLSINCYGHDPQVAAVGGGSPRVNYWCDGAGAAGVVAKMRLLFCSGSIDATGKTFAATNGGLIAYAVQRGPATVLAGQAGTVTDVG